MLDIVAFIKPEATKPVTPTGANKSTDQGHQGLNLPASNQFQHPNPVNTVRMARMRKTHKPSNDNNDNDITDTHAFNHKPRRALQDRAVK